MRFKPSSIIQYCEQWKSLSPVPIHQSNPQPFTLGELETIIGSTDSVFDQQQSLSYATVQGDKQLREAITSIYDHNNSDQIATFAGAQEAIFCCLNALLKPGDKVAAISPVFEPLINPARDLDCDIQLVSLIAEDRWKVDFNKLEDVVRSGCKLLIINFPHNPTGAMISKEELLQIIKICDENNCWILSDEVFRGLEHNPEQRLPPVADLYSKAISISVLSKAFALPALRIGWISCQDKSVLDRTLEIKSSLSICNSLLDEKMATKIILQHEEIWSRNRNLITRNLGQLNKFMSCHQEQFEFIKPEAACICFPLLRNKLPASDYAQQLIEKHNVLVLPGKLFSTSLNGFRLGFGSEANLAHLNSLTDPAGFL